MAEIAAEVAAERQVLVVVNTTADSAALHRLAGGAAAPFARELPAPVDPDDGTAPPRRAGEIRDRLAAGQPVALISTQLIEAGVDVDFPVVYRAWAPADSLQQAAGRATATPGCAEGRVVIFRPRRRRQPRDASYKAALDATGATSAPAAPTPTAWPSWSATTRSGTRCRTWSQRSRAPRSRRCAQQMDFPAVAADVPAHRGADRPGRRPLSGDERGQGRGSTRSSRPPAGPDPVQAGDARQLLRDFSPYLATIPKHLARQAQERGWASRSSVTCSSGSVPYHPARGIDPADC